MVSQGALRANVYCSNARRPQALLPIVGSYQAEELKTSVRFFARVKSTFSRRCPLVPLTGPNLCIGCRVRPYVTEMKITSRSSPCTFSVKLKGAIGGIDTADHDPSSSIVYCGKPTRRTVFESRIGAGDQATATCVEQFHTRVARRFDDVGMLICLFQPVEGAILVPNGHVRFRRLKDKKLARQPLLNSLAHSRIAPRSQKSQKRDEEWSRIP
jgi:hypothetical protein